MKNANVTYTMLFINLEFYMTFPNDISRLFSASFVEVTPIDWQAALSKIFTLAVINLMRNIFIYELFFSKFSSLTHHSSHISIASKKFTLQFSKLS